MRPVIVAVTCALVAGCGNSSKMPAKPMDMAEAPGLDPQASTVRGPTSGVVADGTPMATIAIHLVDTAGAAVVGAQVTITASGTGNTVTQPLITDGNGDATAKLG